MTLDLDYMRQLGRKSVFACLPPETARLSDGKLDVTQPWYAMIDELSRLRAEIEAANYDGAANERLESFRYWLARHKELRAENERLRAELDEARSVARELHLLKFFPHPSCEERDYEKWPWLRQSLADGQLEDGQ